MHLKDGEFRVDRTCAIGPELSVREIEGATSEGRTRWTHWGVLTRPGKGTWDLGLTVVLNKIVREALCAGRRDSFTAPIRHQAAVTLQSTR